MKIKVKFLKYDEDKHEYQSIIVDAMDSGLLNSSNLYVDPFINNKIDDPQQLVGKTFEIECQPFTVIASSINATKS